MGGTNEEGAECIDWLMPHARTREPNIHPIISLSIASSSLHKHALIFSHYLRLLFYPFY